MKQFLKSHGMDVVATLAIITVILLAVAGIAATNQWVHVYLVTVPLLSISFILMLVVSALL
jgi:hypothetical protein